MTGRRRYRRRAAALAVVGALGLAACGDDATTATATSATDASTSSVPSTITTTLVDGKPHFATPEDAMTYLADAWNRHDLVSLKHVTDPSARDELDAMHQVATDLRLDHCTPNTDRGDYDCTFDHDYPAHASTTMAVDDPAMGHAVFVVGPADTPGWYMTVLESCS